MDYRFVENINCCGDDHSYYLHSETLAQDFDLDYSNQLEGITQKGKIFINEDKRAPLGFIGSGILSAPFMFIGIKIDQILNSMMIKNSDLMSYKIMFYSIAPIFYLMMSYLLLTKIKNEMNVKFNNLIILLAIFGTGVHYYAFERYSMTHVYEFFTTTLIIYVIIKFYNSKSARLDSFFASVVPFAFLIGFLTRYVNYFIFLIPFWIVRIDKFKNINKRIFKYKSFQISLLFVFIIFYILSKRVYGVVSFSPLISYNKNSEWLDEYSEYIFSISSLFLDRFLDLIKIFTTQEFGLFWFMPILIVSVLYLFRDILENRSKNLIRNLLFLISIGIPIFLVLIWQTVASAFGMRYIFGVIPICIVVSILYSSPENKLIKFYLISFSLFSFLSVLFFETSAASSLSEIDQINTWGILTRWAQPSYLTGVIDSFFKVDSYQIIFGTSLLGSLIIKIFIEILTLNGFMSFLSNLGLNIENGDVLNTFAKIQSIEIHKFMILVLISILFVYQVIKNENNYE